MFRTREILSLHPACAGWSEFDPFSRVGFMCLLLAKLCERKYKNIIQQHISLCAPRILCDHRILQDWCGGVYWQEQDHRGLRGEHLYSRISSLLHIRSLELSIFTGLWYCYKLVLLSTLNIFLRRLKLLFDNSHNYLHFIQVVLYFGPCSKLMSKLSFIILKELHYWLTLKYKLE